MALVERRSSRDCIEEDTLFAEFELAGIIGDELASHLPEHLWVVFEIARVIESKDTQLGRTLAPILTRVQSDPSREHAPPIPTVAAEEYEADLIRHFHELPQIYPYQFLLPEEVFFQRLAERSLWLPRPVPPRMYRFPTASDTFAPDPRKQKVYVLFDVSRSMNSHWRIALAKAIAIVFLRQNMRQLGTIYLRTFAEHVGERTTASDVPSFRQLLRTVLRLEATGRGTNMQEAIEVAIADINGTHTLSDAEILLITDGAAHLDLERLKTLMGSNIRIHAIKIGNERIAPDPTMVEYYARKIGTADARRLLELQDRRRALEHELQYASTAARRTMIAHDLSVLDRMIAGLAEGVAVYATEHFGSDIEQLCSIFVQVDDIDPAEVFRLSREREQELVQLARALLDEFARARRTEDADRMAALIEHLRTILQFNQQAAELQELAATMEQTLGDFFRQLQMGDIEMEPTLHAPMLEHVRIALRRSRRRIALAQVLRLLWRRLVRWLRRQRKLRVARILLRRWRRR